MNQWLSSSDVASLLGISQRAANKRAEQEGWASRPRQGRGGGREYSVESLPPQARAKHAARKTADIVELNEFGRTGELIGSKMKLAEDIEHKAAEARRIEALKTSTTLSEGDQRRMDAKNLVLRALDLYRHDARLSLQKAEHLFADAYNKGEITVPEWVREIIPGTSVTSLGRWRRDVKKNGITALAGNYGKRRGTGKVDQQEIKNLIIGILIKKPHARSPKLLQAIEARFGEGIPSLPSLRSIERFVKRWKAQNEQTLMALANPDRWKNDYMVAFGSASEGIVRLNQRWEMDATPGDVMLTDGRHSVLGVIDVRSRRARLLVSRTPRATAYAALFRRTLLDWGVPDEVKHDHGQVETSNHVQRVFTSLDIKPLICPPFQPWLKPHIERFFRTFSHDLVELLDGFLGHNVAERKAIEARRSFADKLMKRGEVIEVRMSSAEFQEFCDRWCEDVYGHQPHASLQNKTPFQIAADSRDTIRRIADEHALDILLAEAPDNNGMRTVQKRGINLDSAWFIAPELEALVGQVVQVKYDAIEHDLGRVYVFGGPDLQFVCVAECPERTGIDRREVAIRAREKQKKRVQDERRALKEISKSVRTDDIVGDILRDKAIKAGKLRMFPKPAEAHESMGLSAAAEAAAAAAPDERTSAELMSPETFAAARAAIEVKQQARQEAERVWESAFDKALHLAEQSLTRDLAPEEREWLAAYRKQNPKSAQGIDGLIEARFGAVKGPAAAG